MRLVFSASTLGWTACTSRSEGAGGVRRHGEVLGFDLGRIEPVEVLLSMFTQRSTESLPLQLRLCLPVVESVACVGPGAPL